MPDPIAPVDPAHTALLVMDYQDGIVARLPDPAAMLDRAAEAIAIARRAGTRVGYVRVAFEDADFDAVPAHGAFARIAERREAMHADAPATAVSQRLAPRDGDIVVRKTRIGAFSTTDLDAQLRAAAVTTVVLAGISTSGVVLSTVRDAHDRDYRVLVLADATADPRPEVHDFLVAQIFPAVAEIVTLSELEPLLSGQAAG